MSNVIAFAGPVASAKDAPTKELRFWSGADLATRTSNKTKWIVYPWVAEGAITEVDGKAKTAGKTTWLTHMVRAVLDGQPFLDEPTTKTPVVYLTEQSEATFRVALDRAGLLGRGDLSVLFWHETIGASWPEIVKAARDECRRIEAKLLIVDTLAQFTGIDGDGENSAGEALRAMEPLQRAAHRRGLGVVVSRHERKSGGDVGDSGRGSSAFAGVMDTICSIRRLDGNGRDTLRVIRSVSRIGEAPGELVIELTEQGYVPRGSVFDIAMREAEAAILAAAPGKKKRALTRDELMEAAEVKPSTGTRAIKKLVEQGQLLRMGAGKKNDPYRYWLRPEESENDDGVGVKKAAEEPDDPNPDKVSPLAAGPRAATRRTQGPDEQSRGSKETSRPPRRRPRDPKEGDYSGGCGCLGGTE